jgi:hypothetical protein
LRENLTMELIKVGDRFFLYCGPGKSAIISIKDIHHTIPNCWKTDCDFDFINFRLYDFELEDMTVNGFPLIKIENDYHLLQLQLKYS